MKRLVKKFEDVMVAITFAEAGEYELVGQLLNQHEMPEEPLEDMTEAHETV